MINIFPSICYHAMNVLSSFNVLKEFQDYFQDTEKKMIEIMAKSESSYLVCNVIKNAKKPHTVVSLMIKETIIIYLTHVRQFYCNSETNLK